MSRYSAIAAALLCTAAVPAAAQTPTVTARIEPDSIGIGDRFDYVIDVEKDVVQVVQFPEFEPAKEGDIELVRSFPTDTLERDGRRLKLRKRYRLAAFEEGRYNLGRAEVLYADKNIVDTLRAADSLLLEVTRSRATRRRSRSTTSSRRRPCRSVSPRFAAMSSMPSWSLHCSPQPSQPWPTGSDAAARAWATCSRHRRLRRPTWRPSRRSKPCTTRSCGRTRSTNNTTPA